MITTKFIVLHFENTIRHSIVEQATISVYVHINLWPHNQKYIDVHSQSIISHDSYGYVYLPIRVSRELFDEAITPQVEITILINQRNRYSS